MVGHVPEMPREVGSFIVVGAREILRRGLHGIYGYPANELPIDIRLRDDGECQEAGCDFYCRTHGEAVKAEAKTEVV